MVHGKNLRLPAASVARLSKGVGPTSHSTEPLPLMTKHQPESLSGTGAGEALAPSRREEGVAWPAGRFVSLVWGCHIAQVLGSSRILINSSPDEWRLITDSGNGKMRTSHVRAFWFGSRCAGPNIASGDASPRSERSGRLDWRRRLGEFNERQPTSLAQVSSKRNSASR
jgi:hypothetical protein